MKRYLYLILIILFVLSCTDHTPSPDIPIEQEPSEQSDESYLFGCTFEVPAQFPGGYRAWNKFARENLKRPKECVEGKVFLSFMVSITGELSDIEVIRGIYPIADQYAIELLQKSPKWIPGEQRGIPVKTRMMISIRFSLDS